MDTTASSDLAVGSEGLDTNNAGAEMDDWATPVSNCDLSPVKVSVSSSRLLFLAVEYSEPSLDYTNGAFSTFEPGAPFSPQPSTCLSDFERVSPLDPNLNSAARYSQVYGSLDVSTTEEELSEALQSQVTQSQEYNEVESLSGPIRLIQQYRCLSPTSARAIQQPSPAPAEEDLKCADNEEVTNQVLANIASAMFANRTSDEDDLQMVTFDPEMEDSMKGASDASIEMLLCDAEAESQMQPVSDRVVVEFTSEGVCDVECGLHERQVQAIADKPVPLRSRATLPALYLAISKTNSSSGGNGVFARRTIPKQTRFGPIEGIMSKVDFLTDAHSNTLQLIVEDDLGNMFELDISDDNCSNWMRFVGRARCYEEQNLAVSQQGSFLYYTTTQAVHPTQELLVWYSQSYALKRGLAPLQPASNTSDMAILSVTDASSCQDVTLWPCFDCNQLFPTSDALHKHLNFHCKEAAKTKASSCQSLHHRKWKKSVWKKSVAAKHEKVLPAAYQCSTCHRRFPHSYNLKRHQLIHCVASLKTRSRSIMQLRKQRSSLKNMHAGRMLVDGGVDTADAYVDAGSDTEGNGTAAPAPTAKVTAGNKQRVKGRKFRGLVNPAKPCKCELCYKAFATEDRLQRHMLVHGAEDSKPLQCDICYKRFLNNSALSCHVKVHTEKMFECPICKSIFNQVLLLKEHVTTHAQDGVYSCAQCSKQFEEYSLIRKHIRGFHGDRKHYCSCCTKLFPTLDKLRMHMLRHSDHREFLCANCGKQFKRKDKLKEHMRRMHSVERELLIICKPARMQANKKYIPKVQVSPLDYSRFIYKCHLCLLGFKRRGMLVNHLAKRHPDISPESVPELNLPILKTTRDYYCQYCEKVYKSSSKRKAHILKNHPGAELPMSNRRKGGVPVIPGVPNPTFSQTVGSVTTRPHGCAWCHKQYASKAKLLQHQRKKHPHLVVLSSSQMGPDMQSSVESMGEETECDPNSDVHSVTILSNNFQIPIEDLGKSMNGNEATSPNAHIIKVFSGSDLLTQAMSELSQSLSRDFPGVSAEQCHQLLATAEFTPH